MANYIRLQNIDLTYTDWLRKQEDDGKNKVFNDTHTTEWQEYQDWIAEGNTPEDQYSLDDIKQVCIDYAQQQHAIAVQQPVNDGIDDIALDLSSKSKVHNSKAVGKATAKVKLANGHRKTVTADELDDILDAIEDRDDLLLDELEDKLDAIDDAESVEDLVDYLPPTI